jgi:hypothetical protein
MAKEDTMHTSSWHRAKERNARRTRLYIIGRPMDTRGGQIENAYLARWAFDREHPGKGRPFWTCNKAEALRYHATAALKATEILRARGRQHAFMLPAGEERI